MLKHDSCFLSLMLIRFHMKQNIVPTALLDVWKTVTLTHIYVDKVSKICLIISPKAFMCYTRHSLFFLQKVEKNNIFLTSYNVNYNFNLWKAVTGTTFITTFTLLNVFIYRIQYFHYSMNCCRCYTFLNISISYLEE